jgi:diguanylate cyclase (GGDEF)-like protein
MNAATARPNKLDPEKALKKVLRSERREHNRLKVYSILGAAIHALLLVYFVSADISWLVYFNIIALCTWLLSVFLVSRKRYRVVVVATSITTLCQLTLATIIFGTESGVLMGLWPLACIFVINTRTKVLLGIGFAVLCLLSFIFLNLYAPATTTYPFPAFTREAFIIISGAAMVSGVMSIKSAFRSRRNQMIYIANHDSLTGLKNRRFFTTFISHQQAVVQREGTRFCLAIGDIDHFKNINDTHGHQIGDAVLIGMANCFNEILAQSDVICRWGGEEFLIFIPESDVGLAYPVLEAIREVVSEQNIHGVTSTISFGLVESDGKQSLDELVKAADLLLYKAKENGRNRVEYEPTI